MVSEGLVSRPFLILDVGKSRWLLVIFMNVCWWREVVFVEHLSCSMSHSWWDFLTSSQSMYLEFIFSSPSFPTWHLLCEEEDVSQRREAGMGTT
jgi:hypothetical protein